MRNSKIFPNPSFIKEENTSPLARKGGHGGFWTLQFVTSLNEHWPDFTSKACRLPTKVTCWRAPHRKTTGTCRAAKRTARISAISTPAYADALSKKRFSVVGRNASEAQLGLPSEAEEVSGRLTASIARRY